MTDQKETETTDSEIARSSNVLTSIVLPLTILAVVLAAFMWSGAHHLLGACDDYTPIELIYPLIFGGVGAIIGGSVALDGPFQIFGVKWNARIAGGIAAAVVGFAIAQWVKPKSCMPRHEIIFRNFLMEKEIETVVDGKKSLQTYMARIDIPAKKVHFVVDDSNRSSRDFRILFDGQSPFRINFDFVSRGGPGSEFQLIEKCFIEVLLDPPPQEGGYEKFQLEQKRSVHEIGFNPAFFSQIESTRNNASAETNCLIGRRRGSTDKEFHSNKVSGTLYVSSPEDWRTKLSGALDIWFVFPAKPDDKEPENPAKSARAKEIVDAETPQPSNIRNEPSSLAVTARPAIPAGCTVNDSIKADIDKFLSGDDLDQTRRGNLYAAWKSSQCYIWPFAMKKDSSLGASERARTVRLAVNTIINQSQIADQPRYWQPEGNNRRDFSKDLPYLANGDYRTLFDFLQVDDLALRTEALRMVRLVPVDRFEILFKAANDRLSALDSAQRERLAIAAAFLYYNRIVEWLDTDPPSSRDDVKAAVDRDFAASKRWINDALLGKSSKSYEAMLWYARAIVEKERSLTNDDGRSSFQQMLTAVKLTDDVYPSSFRHLAQAVAITESPNGYRDILRQITQVETLPSSTPLPFDIASATSPLFAGPGETFPKMNGSFSNKPTTRALLRKDDWYLASAQGAIGWLRRPK